MRSIPMTLGLPAAIVIAGLSSACGPRPAGSGSGGAGGNPSGGGKCETAPGSSPCRACTQQGLVQGAATNRSCAYLGIPYAKPPVGNLRFAAPEPAAGWSGVRNSTAFGTACMQGMDLSGTTQIGEDCLFVNVWTPAAAAAPLPVMVFIHGGGYNGGSTNTYVGVGLSDRGSVVVVSMNYRLGALGFFAHPDLDRQRADKPSGSDGIRDQQLALEWVQKNIASFHGDPNNVTVFGESAGASSAGIHALSPGTRGLARRFILESGMPTRGVGNGIAPVSKDAMYKRTQQMAAALCPGAADVIACLRGLPASRLMSWAPSTGSGGQMNPGWVPVVEGAGGVLPDTPDALMQRGEFSPGEIIIGTNKNEYGLFALLSGGASTVAQMRARVQAQYPDAVDQIMALYAPSGTVDINQAYITLMTDVMFRCATRSFARLAAAKGRSVYLYSYEQGTAVHSEEMNYVFGPGNFTLGFFAPDFAVPIPALLDGVQGYWTNFARTGDPNGPGLVVWPKFDAAGDRHLTLARTISAGSALEKAQCDFWDNYLERH
jgi:para-nitrobenzyl esterase